MKTVDYHVCPNDCVVFRDCSRYKYSKLYSCPVCQKRRFYGNRQPRRRFIYYPIIPRLQRLYTCKSTSELLQSHAYGASLRDLDLVSDIWDTQQWENAFGENGIFCGDPRGIALQFSTDGVNPYSANKVQYFMWPMMTTLLNLPKNLRHLFSGISLLGIIPGNDGEPKKSDPYMEILVDELFRGCSFL